MSHEELFLEILKAIGTIIVWIFAIKTFGPILQLTLERFLKAQSKGNESSAAPSNDAAERKNNAVFQFFCPEGHLLQGALNTAGQVTKCPTCAAKFIIPHHRRETAEPTNASPTIQKSVVSPPRSAQ